jgi:hypothetical protein
MYSNGNAIENHRSYPVFAVQAGVGTTKMKCTQMSLSCNRTSAVTILQTAPNASACSTISQTSQMRKEKMTAWLVWQLAKEVNLHSETEHAQN